MKKALFAGIFLAFLAAAPARADLSMACDIGTITLSAQEFAVKDGKLIAMGRLDLLPRDPNLRLMWPHNRGGDIGADLPFQWDGSANKFSTELGDIILTPQAGAPRISIEMPQPYDQNDAAGAKNFHSNQRLKQQDCILTN